MSSKPIAVRQTIIKASDLEFSALEAGQAGCPVCLCVHGFPDHARTWRHLLPLLASVGYHAIAPNTRGYTPSSIPADGRYHAVLLARDILNMLDALRVQQAVLVGHDWGADAVYGASILAPHRVRCLVTLAGPHPINQLAASSYQQLKRFWYSFYFLTPDAERFIRANNFDFLDQLWQDWSPGFQLEPEERDALKKTFSAPGVLTATLGYYRALFESTELDKTLLEDSRKVLSDNIPVETFYIHGADDGCIGVELTQNMDKAYLKGVRKLIVDKAGHFVHLERPVIVNEAILSFIGSSRISL